MEPDSEEHPQHKSSDDRVDLMLEGDGTTTSNTDYETGTRPTRESEEHEQQTRPVYPSLTSAVSSESRKEEVLDVHRDL